jgi:phage-related tail fiber protein
MGSNRWEVARVNWEDAGSGGQLACRAVAEAVYRATLARVIADREHIVTLNAAETAQLRRWLNGEPNGSNWIGDRLTVNYDGNGVWIRTRPYSSQHIPR